MQAFLFYPQSSRWVYSGQLHSTCWSPLPLQEADVVSEHKLAICREARLLEENPARVLQENYKLQPGLTQDCLAAASAAHLLSSGQLGKNSKTATPHCPKGPKGTVRIPDQDMPFFPEEGLSVPWQRLLFQHSSLETEGDMKWNLKCPLYSLKKYQTWYLRKNQLASNTSMFLVKLW